MPGRVLALPPIIGVMWGSALSVMGAKITVHMGFSVACGASMSAWIACRLEGPLFGLSSGTNSEGLWR